MLATLVTFVLYSLTVFVPLAFTTWNVELFEFPKFILLISGTLILSILIVADHIISRKNPLTVLWKNSTKLSKLMHTSVLAVLATQTISTLLSLNVHTSFWGYYGRFHQGLLTTICFTVIYFAAVLYLNKKSTQKLINISIGTAIIISLYGIAEHFGIDKDLWIQDVQNRVFSTLGQPNWLAAYLLPHFFLLHYQDYIKKHQGQNISIYLYIVYCLLFIALLFTKSRSGLVAYGISFILYWALMLRNFGYSKIKSQFALYTITISLLTIFIGSPLTFTLRSLGVGGPTTTAPVATQPSVGPALEVGGTESGDIRKIVWSGALELIRKNPIFGTGPETFAYTYYSVRPLAHNYVSEWDFLYNKAHNEYLNMAANTGLVGLSAYLLYHLAFVLFGLQKQIKTSKKVQDDDYIYQNAIAPVLVATISSFAITNFFGFSVIPVYLITILVAAVASTHQNPSVETKPINSEVALPLTIILALVSLIIPYCLYLADYDFALAKGYVAASSPTQALPILEKALTLRPSEDLYQATAAEVYASLAYLSNKVDNKDQTKYYEEKTLSTIRVLLTLNPYHQNNLKSIAKAYLTLASYNPTYHTQAAEVLLSAQLLAPNDPKLSYNLGLVYTRLNDYDKARAQLRRAIAQKNNYADAYYALTLVLEESNRTSELPALMQDAKSHLATYSGELGRKMDEYLAQ